ncbi:MAG: redoxin domain-containing protein [Bacteroidales bacterium]|nr:redoxin domain-containing protein [Bacteroidales bacterium]MCL2132982.1 redoxin domain-containing protein [Bacteroidales bacterium]
MKRILLSLQFLLVCLTGLYAQGYRIELTLDGLKDTTVFLAIHSGDKKYSVDTATVNHEGKAVFQKNKSLVGGMYLLATNDYQLFDFLISDEENQNFSIYAKAPEYSASLKYTNSPENQSFIDFQQYLRSQQKRVSELVKRSEQDPLFQVADSLEVINKEVEKYIQLRRQEYKGTLLATVLKAAFPAAAPKPDIPDGTPKRDSLLWRHYYDYDKLHYFDGIDFSDSRIVYTPLLHSRIEEYFSKRLIQTPESLNPQVDMVLDLAEANSDVYSTVLSQLFNKYVNAEIMGMEAVALHIGEKYVLTGKASWLDSAALAKVQDFVEHNRYSLIGMQAKELKLQSLSGPFESVYAINSPYLVLLFYEPGCGHCKTEMPKLYDVFQRYRNKGVQVMAVCTIHKYNEWVKYVTENNYSEWINVWDGFNKEDNISIGSRFREYYNVYTTPQVYLLDKDKTIIGRRLDSKVLEQILEHRTK